MAIKLQYDTIIVPRAHFARCRDLPAYLSELHAEGGILFEINWYDRHLWCETTMHAPQENVAEWEARGLVSGVPPRRPDGPAQQPWQWRDLCVAASGRGPYARCEWLEYDPDDNCVWLKGTEKGPVIGGRDHLARETQRLGELREKAEQHYTRMYDARHPKDEFEDASTALAEAIRVAAFLHRPDLDEEIRQRQAHIESIYNSQFRNGGPR